MEGETEARKEAGHTMRVSPQPCLHPSPPRRTLQNHRVQEQVQHSCGGGKRPSLCPFRFLAETPGVIKGRLTGETPADT